MIQSDARTTTGRIEQRISGDRSHATYRADIQGLRGLAILAVVGYHAGLPFLEGGFVGVDVFFVLSGYLITGLLVKEFHRTGRVRIRDFSARRIRRLLPASAVVLLTTLAASVLFYSPFALKDLGRTGQMVATYVSNMFFGFRATNYLRGDSSSNPFLQTWSLAVEEQFYLVWPLTISAVMWIAGRRVGARRVILGTAVLAVSVLSFLLSLVLMSKRQNWAFFATPPRMWEFGAGALAVLATPKFVGLRRPAIDVAGVVGLALVVLPVIVYGPTTTFPGLAVLAPVVGTTLILMSGGSSGSLSSRSMSMGVFGWFGTYSYSWYLWHWPFLVIARMLWPSWDLWRLGLVAVVSLGVAVGSFHLVEQPVRYSRWLSGRTGVTLLGVC